MGKAASAAQKRVLVTVVSGGRDQGQEGNSMQARPAASHPHPTLASPVFTAPAESEGSGPEEKSPGQQVR